MEKEMTYEEASKKILELLAELLTSLKLQEGAIWEIFITLPEPTQQYDLMDWLVDELEERTPSEVEIVAKAYKIAEEFKEIKEK